MSILDERATRGWGNVLMRWERIEVSATLKVRNAFWLVGSCMMGYESLVVVTGKALRTC